MNKLIFLFLNIVLLTTMISCEKDSTNTVSKNPVACFINGNYDQTGFVIAQIKDSSTFQQSVAFPGASSTVEITAGNHPIRFIEKATGLELSKINFNFTINNNYSLVLCNKKSSVESFLIQNDVTIKDTNNTSIKFLNLIPNSNLDIFINGNIARATNLGFKSFTGPIELNPKTANSLVIRQSGSSVDLLTNNNFRGTAKKSFTIFLTGILGNTPAPSMNFISHN